MIESPAGAVPFAGRGWRVAAAIICLAAVCWLASGFLIGAQPDEEEYRHAIPSTMVAAEAMRRGELAFWTSDLGLGVPQPFGQSLTMHPLTPLLGVVPVVAWVNVFYTLHLIGAAWGMWLLARRVGASSLASAIAVATYVLASPAQNYALSDFWPSTWPVYTLAPLIVVAMLALADAGTARARWRASLGLGLAAGLLGATGHQGYLVVFIPGCAAFLLAHARAVMRGWPWWLLAAAIAGILAAPITFHLATELGLAPEMLDQRTYLSTVTLDGLWDVFVRPLWLRSEDWAETTRERGVRVLFFGGPAAVLAIFYSVRVRTRMDLLLGALVSLIPLVVPGVLISKYVSAIYLFRDPLILFAAPCAALALDWIAAKGTVGRRTAVAIAAAQLLILGAAVWPFIARNLAARQQPVTDVFVGELPVSSWLRDAVAASDSRVYYTAGVDDLLWTGQLNFDGIWRNSMFYRGVRVINSQISFVSLGAIAPEGAIRGVPEATAADLTLLSVAGARWVLARADEPVSPALVRRSERTSSRGVPLVLYENPRGFGAVFVDDAAAGLALPVIPGCAHDKLFCRDFARLAPHLYASPVRVERSGGRVSATFGPAGHDRLLLIGEMYRDGWQVAEAGMRVEPLLGGLISVRVPAFGARVTLRFRPPLRAGLGIAAWTTMMAAACGFALTFRRAV